MKKLDVCAVITYHYQIEVRDYLCSLDKNGYAKHEAELVNICGDRDPIEIDGNIDNLSAEIVSIYNGDEYLYNA